MTKKKSNRNRNLLIIGGIAVAGLLLFMPKSAGDGGQTATTTTSYGGGVASTGYLAGEAQRQAPITDARTINYNIDLGMPSDIWGTSEATGAEVLSTQTSTSRSTGHIIDFDKQQTSATETADIFERTTASASDRFVTLPEAPSGYVADRHAQQSITFEEAERRQAEAPKSLFQELTGTPSWLNNLRGI